MPGRSPSFRGRLRRVEDRSEHAVLDELDVAIVVSRHAPWQLRPLHVALAADLGGEWRGGVVVVEDGAPAATATAAREALAAHHHVARRTILTLRRRIGATGAFDLAAAEGTGEYVALVDVATRPAPGTLGTLLDELRHTPRALWAAAPAPGCAVVRRDAFLTLGGFDPGLRDGDALRDLAARAQAACWALLTVPDARVRRDSGGAPARRPPLGQRASTTGSAPGGRWSGAALDAWLPRARRAAQRTDLP